MDVELGAYLGDMRGVDFLRLGQVPAFGRFAEGRYESFESRRRVETVSTRAVSERT